MPSVWSAKFARTMLLIMHELPVINSALESKTAVSVFSVHMVFPVVLAAVCADKLALAVLLASLPLALILASTTMEDALAMPHVVLVLSFVRAPIGKHMVAVAMHLAIVELTPV